MSRSELASLALPLSGDSLNRFIVDSMPVAVLTVDPDLVITNFNPWAEQITGYTRQEAVGRPCGEILRGGECGRNCPLRSVLSQGNRILRMETTIRHKDGHSVSVGMNTAGLFDGDGRLLGGLEAFQDITVLKQSQREKDNLISMFAHDLKSSVVVMGGFARRVLTQAAATRDDTLRRPLEIIRSEADKLEALTNEFLEFSRLQTGRLPLNPSAVALETELAELVDAYQLQAREAGVALSLQLDEAPPVIQADPQRLHRLFANLLSNAIKYSPAGTTVSLTLQDLGPALLVRVQDQGRGIDPAELPYIFDPFHRSPDAEPQPGFGLGLATVKAIAEAHGGRVRVQSEPGLGSVFTVELPKHSAGTGPGSPRRD